MPNKMTSFIDVFSNTSIHDAGFLDLPFIFDLIVRGSLDGSFGASVISSSGYISLLLSLFMSLRFFSKLKSLRSRKNERPYRIDKELLIFSDHNEPVGFLQVRTFQDESRNIFKIIDTCAIKYERRGQGYGKCMISQFLEMQPAGTEFWAYCNKYAKSMQHIFKNMHFRRTSVRNGLEQYTLGKSEAKVLDALAKSNH